MSPQLKSLFNQNINQQNRVVIVVDPPVHCYHSNDGEKIISPASHWASSAADKVKGQFINGGIVEDANFHEKLGLCLLVNRPLENVFFYNKINKCGFSVCAQIHSYYSIKDHIYIYNDIKLEDYTNVGIISGCNIGTHTFNVDLPNINTYYSNLKSRRINSKLREYVKLKNQYGSLYIDDINKYQEKLNNWKMVPKFNQEDLNKLFPNVMPSEKLKKINTLLGREYGKTNGKSAAGRR